MSVEERLKSLKENTIKTKCTFGDENDREGYLYEIRDTDFAWLLGEIYSYKKIAESQARILEGILSDVEIVKNKTNAALEHVEYALKTGSLEELESSLEEAKGKLNFVVNFMLAEIESIDTDNLN